MEGLLQIFCNHRANDWAKWLPLIQYIINSRPSSTTKRAPYELWMGHVPRAHQVVKDLKVPDLVRRQKDLKTAREEAALAMQHAQELWVKPTNYRPYQEGERVWLKATHLHTTHPTKKLGPKRYGPFKVLEQVGHVNFHLELPAHWKIHDVFHTKLLHPYTETKEHRENFTEPPPDLVEGVAEWEVEKILDMRTRRSQKQYLIRWKGYSDAHNSWEPWENIKAPLLMAKFEKQGSAQRGEDAQGKLQVQKRNRRGAIRVICLDTSSLTQVEMCNQTPPTPARSITPESPFIPSPPSSMSSNSRAVHYVTAATLYGQQQRRAARERAAEEEEEEVAPEDSASAQVSPTNEVTNSLDALALIRDELAASEDIVMGEEVPQGFEEALQSFRAMDDELEAILSGDPEAQFDLSWQVGRRTARPPTNNAKVGLEEVFMEQGVADTSPTTEREADAGPLPLEDDTSSVMSSLSSQLSDIAPHPSYPFWKYRRTTHGAPIMLPDTLPQRGVPQQANYVALNVERHDGEPTVYSTMGGGAPIYCNVLHAEPRPEIPPGNGGDDLYLLGERFQMDYIVTRAIEAVGDAGVAADIYRLRCFSERKCEIQREQQRLSRLADFLTSEWQRHYGEEKRLRAQEEAAIKQLIAARVTERMEPYIHFNDEHAYLSHSHMRNDILCSGWNELEQNYSTDIT